MGLLEMRRAYLQDRQWSESTEVRNFLLSFYQQKFPSFDCVLYVPPNTIAQRMGRDACLLSKNNPNPVWIDEKLRRSKYADYARQELLVETRKQSGTLGWIQKTLWIDFLVYGSYGHSDTMKVIKWPLLKQAWELRKNEWLQNELMAGDTFNCPIKWKDLSETFKEIQNGNQ